MEVPAGLKITANGQSVDDSYKTATGTAASNFSGLSDTSGAPLVDTYTLKNLLGKPKIEVEGQSGYGTLDDVLLGSNTIYVGKTSTDSDLANAFINDAQIIAAYPAQDGSLGQVAAVSMPTDDQLRAQLKEINAYSLMCIRAVLERIEHFGSYAKVDTDDLNIEHIML